jgi:hypothetical protein
MIHLEDGLSLCGRCVCGLEVGYIIRVDRETYTISWRDGETTQLRPDIDEAEADSAQIMAQFDAAIDAIKQWVQA